MQIIPIASGKGGVGKSLLSANLAIALAQGGKRVVLADLDLGGSNLHLILGIRNVSHGIGAFLTESKLNFDNIILETEYQGLRFIPGDAEIPGIANLNASQKRMLIRRLSAVDADYLLLDLGAGTSFNTVDFFLMSGQGIILTTPTPTALVNAYLFVKNSVFRIIHNSFKKKSKAAAYLENARKDASSMQRIYIPRLLDAIKDIDPESYEAARDAVVRFRPRLIMNMLEDPKDADKANRLRRSCQQYLDLDMEHLGIMYRDDLQDVALSSRMPIIVYKPASVLAQAIYRVADKVVQLGDAEDEPFGFEEDEELLDESYEEAGIQAEADFETKMDYVEDLLNTGALTTGDLIETIKSQRLEITQLKRHSALLSSRLQKAIELGFEP